MSIKHNGINNWEYSVEGALSFLSKTVKKNIIMHLFTCHEIECDVQTLVNVLDEKQSNVSKHLNDLKKAQVINDKRVGLNSYYYLTEKFRLKYHKILEVIYEIDNEKMYDCICVNDGHTAI
ncbi:helix-turn-helix transcriptional regulator [Mycoplasmopsis cynos]|nr:helix-turn-helix transcriptional regulator [Mycoplasmopsis cynos]WQQ12798.1 helix-turn-helix transcriptional regulator [Mycoplasmopsis cynos]WQQ14007.1 helix-turn-helix transcriptional regulator [Mycoplasmopsis cynos]WQQ14930.1 helix-turn-helix transcriptional regulator [Mycoplasmopsis cynos]WQQ15558.1 helix-turn-helix transcriptional regulator [Mycoplasmopsis cynos]WQQ18033.1 helix-turn-helix transcriptional regulator [Mycoplasmopsis cynos]